MDKGSSSRVVRVSLGALALASLLAGAPALAQTAPAEEEGTRDAEIIVTAQKREERIQDVPVTVNVVPAAQLAQQNITSLGELTRAVPALSGTFVGGGVPQIRGVATSGFSRSAESAVSTVLDGVVLGKTGVSDLFDVERVEVLAGPQGMLFGKNASSGVINIVSVAPKFGEFEVKGSIDYGRFDYERERLTVNVPISDTAALRATGYHNRDKSVVTNALTGKSAVAETWGGRARFRWEPTSNLEINLIGDYAKSTNSGEVGIVFGLIPNPTTTNAQLVADLQACGITNITASIRENCPNSVNGKVGDVERYGFSGQVDLTMGDYVLTSITAKRFVDSGHFNYYESCCDVDATQFPIFDIGPTPQRARVFSQEVRLTSPANQPIDFVAGLYYSKTDTYDEIFQAGTLGFFPNRSTIVPGLPNWAVLRSVTGLPITPQGANEYMARGQSIDVDQASYAAFGQATFHAGDHFSFILGARYTHETLDVDGPIFSPAQLTSILAGEGHGYYPWSPVIFGFTAVNEKSKENNFSWRVGARYEPNPNLTLFATASRGYKGPAVDDQGGSPNPVIRAEIPTAYELGAKATILDGKLFTALTLFHTKVEDFQTTVFVPDKVPAGFASGNAPYMTTKGIDFSFFGSPLEGLTVSGGAIYNIAKFSPDYRVACFTGPTATQTCETVNGASVARPNPQIPNAPKFKFVGNAEYSQSISSRLAAFIQSDVQYQTMVYSSSTPDSVQRLPDQIFVNGRIGVRDPEGRWSASLWGRNLLGKSYRSYTPDFLATFAEGHAGAYITSPNAGQFTTYGVSLSFGF